MAIFLNQTTNALRVAAFFSTKRPEVETFKIQKLELDQDFCTCLIQCVPDLVVFTDKVGADFYKNDFFSLFVNTLNIPPLLIGSNTVGTIENMNTGAETTLVNGLHGELIDGVNFWWFKVEWFKIWQTLGFGRYRLKTKTTSVTSLAIIGETCSPVFHVKPYSDKLANGTVRLELDQQGKLNNSFDFSNLITDTGKGTIYEQQIRLPGALKFESTNEETDHLVLNGTSRPSYQIKDQIRPKYLLEIHLVSAPQFVPTLFDDLFASPVNVSDYNVYNWVADPRNYQAEKYRSLPLIKESANFEPTRNQKRKTFSFGMRYFNDNIFKTNN